MSKNKLSDSDFAHYAGLGASEFSQNAKEHQFCASPHKESKPNWFNRFFNYCHLASGSRHPGWLIYKAIAKPQNVRLLVNGVEQCICCRDTRMAIYGGLAASFLFIICMVLHP